MVILNYTLKASSIYVHFNITVQAEQASINIINYQNNTLRDRMTTKA